MEKKKLLLVAISVGIFLVIAIGAAIVFTPKKAVVPSGVVASHPVPGGVTGIAVPSPSSPSPLGAPGTGSPAGTAAPSQPAPVDPVDLVRGPADVPGLKPAPEGSTRQGSDYYVTGTGQSGSNPQTVISVPRPSSAAIPDTPPPAPKPVAAPAPAPQPVAAAPKPAATPAKPTAQTKTYDDFWVQTGAFSTITKAEGVKESLASRGITSIIENRDVDGRTLFRVRVGPYTSQNEANYWLSLIKSISGFEDSQVRQTRSRR